ncbi:MAG: hypothetical protein AB1921_09760 [Thermodesulfobacteriota bacterium]
MRYDLSLRVSSDHYHADSVFCGYSARDAACGVTLFLDDTEASSKTLRKRERFLVIGQSQQELCSDKHFLHLQSQGRLRIFNPFDPGNFEPVWAALIVRYYVGRARRTKRGHLPELVQEILEIFRDRCNLTLAIESYAAVSEQAQQEFEEGIKKIEGIKTITLNGGALR